MEELEFKKNIDFIRATQRAADGCDLLHRESDRGCVLVGGAILDEMLGAVLRAYFVHDEELAKEIFQLPNAALSTFSSRIRICRALGLITDAFFRDLERIRTIRNQAAHFDRRGEKGFDFAFQNPDVGDRCRALVSIPEDARQGLPPRVLFEIFVTMTSSVFTEYALASRFVADNVEQKLAVHMMLDLMPAVDFQKHMKNLADRLTGREAHAAESGLAGQ